MSRYRVPLTPVLLYLIVGIGVGIMLIILIRTTQEFAWWYVQNIESAM